MTLSTAEQAIELAPTLFRAGGVLPLDGRYSLYPEEMRGFAPSNVYVIRGDGAALIVDSGLPVHEQLLVGQLEELLGSTGRLGLALTRIVEFDSQGNAAALLRRFPIAAFYTNLTAQYLGAGPAHPTPFERAAELQVRAADPAVSAAAYPIVEGEHLGVELSDEIHQRVVALEAPLRLLRTSWLYDRTTRTLFTSDVFVHELGRTSADLVTAEPRSVDEEGVEAVARILAAKFEWLRGADVDPIRSELEEIFDTYAVENVAPGSGRVLLGEAAVTAAYELLQQALRRLGGGPPVSRLREDGVRAVDWSPPERTATSAPPRPVGSEPGGRPSPLPRRLTDGVHWLGDCLELPHGDEVVHSYHSAYLVHGRDASLIVDTGAPFDWSAIEAQLDSLAADVPPVRYLLPTHSEVPHSGNLVRLLRKYPEALVWGDPRDYHLLDPLHDDARYVPGRSGDVVDLGGRTFELLPAVVQDLVTTRWGYDWGARVLFPGDGFAYMHHHARGDCGRTVEELPDLPIEEYLAIFSDYALYWSRFTDMRRCIADLEELLRLRAPALIAPGHGVPILDPEAVFPRIAEGMLRSGMRRTVFDHER